MHRDAEPQKYKCNCIHFQFGAPVSRFIYLIRKWPTDDQTDRHKITKGLRTAQHEDEQRYYTDTQGI